MEEIIKGRKALKILLRRIGVKALTVHHPSRGVKA